MTDPKVTEWFKGDVKPVHVGWYDVSFETFEHWDPDRRYWNGKGWEWMSIFTHTMMKAAVGRNDRWRGLAKKS